MNPLSALFGSIVATRNRLYDQGKFDIDRLQGPVVSVGNISVGGTGKTPLVIALGRELAARGIPYDILSRGYRRTKSGTLRLPEVADPVLYGDEPALMQQELQVPIFVANKRVEAGRRAESALGARLHLLDDGFQHRGLHRDFDIVVLSPSDLNDQLLPAGRLREPLASLARANVVVLPDDGLQAPPAFGGQVWRVHRSLVFDGDVSAPAFAFCGIGTPSRFFEMLRAHGLELLGESTFRDHHVYTEADIPRLVRAANSAGAGLLVTTAKDAIKLSRLTLPSEFSERLRVARLVTEIENSSAAMNFMIDTLRLRCPGWFRE